MISYKKSNFFKRNFADVARGLPLFPLLLIVRSTGKGVNI